MWRSRLVARIFQCASPLLPRSGNFAAPLIQLGHLNLRTANCLMAQTLSALILLAVFSNFSCMVASMRHLAFLNPPSKICTKCPTDKSITN